MGKLLSDELLIENRPVFHVSQLKKRASQGVICSLELPGPEGVSKIEPKAILDRRLVKKNNAGQAQILVEWSNLSESEVELAMAVEPVILEPPKKYSVPTLLAFINVRAPLEP
jgi:hypothetical protein